MVVQAGGFGKEMTMKNKPTKKSIVRWGTIFHFPSKALFDDKVRVELMAPTIKELEECWYSLGARKDFDRKKCTKVKVTKLSK